MTFRKGDFIKSGITDGSFAIFEGRNTSQSEAYPDLTMALYYTPRKYTVKDGFPHYDESVEVATYCSEISLKVHTYHEDYSWKMCNEEEKKDCLAKIEEFGYLWDEKTLSIVDKESGEVIYSMTPKPPTYNGETIPINTAYTRTFLQDTIIEKQKKEKNAYINPYYGGGYCGECWDD